MATETAWSMRGDVMEACSCATTCPCNLDSWATDGHKWLNIPFDNGFVFVADPQAHSAALTQATSYSIPIEGIRNPMNWNLEWSRRARGYPIYAALRALGRRRHLIATCCKCSVVPRLPLLDRIRARASRRRLSPVAGARPAHRAGGFHSRGAGGRGSGRAVAPTARP